jgi:hypothetical protein
LKRCLIAGIHFCIAINHSLFVLFSDYSQLFLSIIIAGHMSGLHQSQRMVDSLYSKTMSQARVQCDLNVNGALCTVSGLPLKDWTWSEVYHMMQIPMVGMGWEMGYSIMGALVLVLMNRILLMEILFRYHQEIHNQFPLKMESCFQVLTQTEV